MHSLISSKTLKLTCIFLVLICTFLQAQTASQITNDSLIGSGNQRLLTNLQAIPSGMTLGGYAETTFNKQENTNGELDVQRLVLLFGYKFDERAQFITEIEYEHVNELYVEQAFLNYVLFNGFNLRAGLMLVPMGILNEYHEPTTFNGVERPSLDSFIVPTTWREIGIGFSGRSNKHALKYQLYLMNGFLSYDGEGKLKGSNGLRSGRQKGIKSTIDRPSIAAKVEYYGLPGLRLGLAGYVGRTQASNEFRDLNGATVGVQMWGFDARYLHRRFSARGQWNYTSIRDVEEYNSLTKKDLGSNLLGYYVEVGYNLLSVQKRQRLDAFVRYENFDTHAKTSQIPPNPNYHRKEWTTGLSYHMAPGVVFKADYQFKKTAANTNQNQFNLGFGVWF